MVILVTVGSEVIRVVGFWLVASTGASVVLAGPSTAWVGVVGRSNDVTAGGVACLAGAEAVFGAE